MKRITFLVPLLLSACFAHKEKSDLPSFNLQLLDGITILNTNKIPDGAPIILLFFSPDCEHCQDETHNIIKNMDSLKEVKFIFITNDPLDRMIVFNEYYKIYRFPNITLGRDYSFFFPKYFAPTGPPYSIIYDKYKKQRGIAPGEINISKLIKFINTL